MGQRGRPKKFDGKVYVRLPIAVEQWIKQKAADQDRDISEIARIMLTEWYKAEALNEGTLIIGVTPWGRAPTLEDIVKTLMERVKKIEEHLGIEWGVADNEEEHPEILEKFGIREIKE